MDANLPFGLRVGESLARAQRTVVDLAVEAFRALTRLRLHELALSTLILNQYCSEPPLKILFQQHRPIPEVADWGRGFPIPHEALTVVMAVFFLIGGLFQLIASFAVALRSPEKLRTMSS